MFDKTFAILLGASALALAATAPCHADEPGKGSTPAPALIHQGAVVQVPDNSPYRARIAVGVATQEAVAHEISVPGVVEADPAAIVNVLPPLAGRVVQLQVGLGDQVRAGQVLARLQSSDLLQAGSDAAKARDAYQLALAQRDRARSVHGEGGNAAKDLEAAESALVQARSELERAEQRLKCYGLPANADLDKLQLPITAPIAGTVTALNVGANAVVNDTTAALLTITNLAQVFVTAQVPESLLSQIHVGQPLQATLSAWPDRPLRGSVAQVSPLLDPDSRRTRVRARFANPGNWMRPNMFATVRLALQSATETLVPLSALVMRNDRVLVFVQTAPWQFEAREVELGVEENELVRVRRGIKPGEKIVVRGGVLLND